MEEVESMPRVMVITMVLTILLGITSLALLVACCFWKSNKVPSATNNTNNNSRNNSRRDQHVKNNNIVRGEQT